MLKELVSEEDSEDSEDSDDSIERKRIISNKDLQIGGREEENEKAKRVCAYLVCFS